SARCAASGLGVYGYLNGVTRVKDAHLQLVRGSQLSVVRRGRLDTEAIQKETALSEGDEVRTGPETEANINLFDSSTVLLSLNTRIKLETLRTSRFFGSRKEVVLQ